MPKPIRRRQLSKPGPRSQQRVVLRAVKAYIAASRRYNYDCNTRLDTKPGDAKRNALMWKSENAFQRMCRLVEAGTENHCINMTPQRQRRMRTVLNQFDWGKDRRGRISRWMRKIWGLT